MKRNTLLLVIAFTAAGLYSRPCAALDLPDLERFLLTLPRQADVPPPPSPYRAALFQTGTLSGDALFEYLHKATSPSIAGNPSDYLKAKKYMFSVADNTGCGMGPGVTGLYSQVCAKGASEHGEDYLELGDANGDGTVDTGGMNAEHAWPQGFFNKAYPMKADLHHIFPTFMTVNNTRGSEPFGEVSHAVYSTNSGSKLGAEGFEPCDAVKGNIARAILYFVVRYYDKNIRDGVNYRDFWASRAPMFLEWDRRDPPDAAEKRRNDMIERFQGNRNPFVDDISLAGRIGLKVFQAH